MPGNFRFVLILSTSDLYISFGLIFPAEKPSKVMNTIIHQVYQAWSRSLKWIKISSKKFLQQFQWIYCKKFIRIFGVNGSQAVLNFWEVSKEQYMGGGGYWKIRFYHDINDVTSYVDDPLCRFENRNCPLWLGKFGEEYCSIA
jgi:hypothetical protein